MSDVSAVYILILDQSKIFSILYSITKATGVTSKVHYEVLFCPSAGSLHTMTNSSIKKPSSHIITLKYHLKKFKSARLPAM